MKPTIIAALSMQHAGSMDLSQTGSGDLSRTGSGEVPLAGSGQSNSGSGSLALDDPDATRQMPLQRLSPLQHVYSTPDLVLRRLTPQSYDFVDANAANTATATTAATPRQANQFTVENNEQLKAAVDVLKEMISNGPALSTGSDSAAAENAINSANTLMNTLKPVYATAIQDIASDTGVGHDQYRTVLNKVLNDAHTGLTTEKIANLLFDLWITPSIDANIEKKRNDLVATLNSVEPLAVETLQMLARWSNNDPAAYETLKKKTGDLETELNKFNIADLENYFQALEKPAGKEEQELGGSIDKNAPRRLLRDVGPGSTASTAGSSSTTKPNPSQEPADAKEASSSSEDKKKAYTQRALSSVQWGAGATRWLLAGAAAIKNVHLSNLAAGAAKADAQYHAFNAAGAAEMLHAGQSAVSDADRLNEEVEHLHLAVRVFNRATTLFAENPLPRTSQNQFHLNTLGLMKSAEDKIAKAAGTTTGAMGQQKEKARQTLDHAKTAMVASVVAQTLAEQHHGQLSKAKTFPKHEILLAAFKNNLNKAIANTSQTVFFTNDKKESYYKQAKETFDALVAEYLQPPVNAPASARVPVAESSYRSTMQLVPPSMTGEQRPEETWTVVSSSPVAYASYVDLPNPAQGTAASNSGSSTTIDYASLPDFVEAPDVPNRAPEQPAGLPAAAANHLAAMEQGQADQTGEEGQEIQAASSRPIFSSPLGTRSFAFDSAGWATATSYGTEGGAPEAHLELAQTSAQSASTMPTSNAITKAMQNLKDLVLSANTKAREAQENLENSVRDLETAASASHGKAKIMLARNERFKEKIIEISGLLRQDTDLPKALSTALTEFRKNPPAGANDERLTTIQRMLENVVQSIRNPADDVGENDQLKQALSTFTASTESAHAAASQAREALATKKGKAQRHIDEKPISSGWMEQLSKFTSAAELLSPLFVSWSAATRISRMTFNGPHPPLGNNATLGLSLAGDLMTVIEFASKHPDMWKKLVPRLAPEPSPRDADTHSSDEQSVNSIVKKLSEVAKLGGAIGNSLYAGSNVFGGGLAIARGNPVVGGIAIGTAAIDGANAAAQFAKSDLTQNKEGGGQDRLREGAENYVKYTGQFSRFAAAALAVGAIAVNQTTEPVIKTT